MNIHHKVNICNTLVMNIHHKVNIYNTLVMNIYNLINANDVPDRFFSKYQRDFILLFFFNKNLEALNYLSNLESVVFGDDFNKSV
jgi:hypothetical protein